VLQTVEVDGETRAAPDRAHTYRQSKSNPDWYFFQPVFNISSNFLFYFLMTTVLPGHFWLVASLARNTTLYLKNAPPLFVNSSVKDNQF